MNGAVSQEVDLLGVRDVVGFIYLFVVGFVLFCFFLSTYPFYLVHHSVIYPVILYLISLSSVFNCIDSFLCYSLLVYSIIFYELCSSTMYLSFIFVYLCFISLFLCLHHTFICFAFYLFSVKSICSVHLSNHPFSN